jgi:HlyD family secretion protein
MKKKIIIGASLVIAVLVVIISFKSYNKEVGQVSIETTKVKTGNVSNVVTATGTVQAIKTVSVGTQVSGIVDKIYVDYNSHVKAGDLLAQLDKRTLLTNLENAQASLDNAKAEMTYQTASYGRIKALTDKSLVSMDDYDQAIYNYTKSQANLKTAQLEYDRARINLNYATIHSPIDGVVLERAVDEGQTVAASFSTPTLFTIAKDLTQMQVEASIDEADIGKVKIGQRVSFLVDAFPDLSFKGEVVQIRLKSITKSNVVTYTVIVKAPNPDMKLMPGMTASITIYVEEAVNVLIVSSKALHFTPDPDLMAAYMQKNYPKGMTENNQWEKDNSGKIDSTFKNVWIKDSAGIRQKPIKVGIDDDLNAQIIQGLKEGDELVTSMNTSLKFTRNTNSAAPSSSPFMPKPPSRNSDKKPSQK